MIKDIIKTAIMYGLTKKMLAFNLMQIPSGTLGLMRSYMPQIDKKYMPQFKSWLVKSGITYTNRNINPSLLKLAQNEIDKNKIITIQNDLKNGATLEPIIISRDNFVIDGSHRFIAALNNKMQSINVIQIDMPALDLIKKINSEFIYVRHRAMSYHK